MAQFQCLYLPDPDSFLGVVQGNHPQYNTGVKTEVRNKRKKKQQWSAHRGQLIQVAWHHMVQSTLHTRFGTLTPCCTCALRGILHRLRALSDSQWTVNCSRTRDIVFRLSKDFFFLVKTCHLHYPQCHSTHNSWVRHCVSCTSVLLSATSEISDICAFRKISFQVGITTSWKLVILRSLVWQEHGIRVGTGSGPVCLFLLLIIIPFGGNDTTHIPC